VLEPSPAALPPRIQVSGKAIDGTALVVDVTVNGHSLPFLPALNGTDISLQVRGNLFPRVEAGGTVVLA
jgi:hypothetical protein